jgi:hypothetical protein
MRYGVQLNNQILTDIDNLPQIDYPSLVKYLGFTYLLIDIFPIGDYYGGKILNVCTGALHNIDNTNNLEQYHGTIILTQ